MGRSGRELRELVLLSFYASNRSCKNIMDLVLKFTVTNFETFDT